MKYGYSVSEDRKYVEVERAGRYELNPGENAADKAKALIVSTQQVPEDEVEVEKVNSVNSGVITSEQPAKRR